MVAIQLDFNSVFLGMFLVLLGACSPAQESLSPAEELYASFNEGPVRDTLHLGPDSTGRDMAGNITFASFFEGVDSSLIEALMYAPDTLDGIIRAQWKLPLDNNFDLCLLEIRQAWFQFKYGLVYDQEVHQFIQLEPLAYFYGGDGGQIRAETWLLPRNILISRQLERALRWTETGETDEEITYRLSGQVWSPPEFRTIAVSDSLFWMQKQPPLR